MKKRVRAILIDVLGLTLIIAAIPISWLPGPGGIPLLIIGLSLLANNHEWAERLMHRIKFESAQAINRMADSSPATKWAIDIISVLFIAGAVLILNLVTRQLKYTVAISLIITGTFMFINNRRRYHALWHKITRTKHKR